MDAKTFLMGSGNPGFSFNSPGDRVVGQICAEPSMQQQKVFGTNELAFWPSGDPKMQMLVPVQTQFRNYEGISNPDRAQPDTGTRTIYVKGKHFERSAREAVRLAGASFLEVGGWIEVTYDGPDMTSKAGMKPKLFSVRYQPPQASASQQHHQHGAPQHQGYGQQGYAQGYPPAAQAPTPPAWQQPGWHVQQAVPAVPAGFGTPTSHAPSPFPQQDYSASAVPSHHGSPAAQPDWSRPVSSPPVPTSVPPAPALSTLDLIRQSEQSGSTDYGSVEPVF